MRRLLVVPLVLVAVLAGCTAAPDPEPVIDAVAVVMPEPVIISGVGNQEANLSVPNGAESLNVRLACTHDRFDVSLSSDMESFMSGGCGGATLFDLPLPESGPMTVQISVDPEAIVLAELTFSSEAVSPDQDLADDCATLGLAWSHFSNADAGFRAGDIDSAGWRDRMDEGVALLETATPSPLFADRIDEMAEWAAAASDPGKAREQQPGAGLLTMHCVANNSVIIESAEYGG